MSDIFDHERDAWESLNWDYDFYFDYGPRNITCKYCKKSGFRWKMTSKGWRLFKGMEQHTCLSRQMQVNSNGGQQLS